MTNKVFFDIEIGGEKAGRIVMGLFVSFSICTIGSARLFRRRSRTSVHCAQERRELERAESLFTTRVLSSTALSPTL